MSVTTFEAIIENGQVRLPEEVVLPERQIVFVVVPGTAEPTTRNFPSLQVTNPVDAKQFEMTVTWDDKP